MHNPHHLQHAEAPKVTSEMPSSVFLRHTATICGTNKSALHPSPAEDHGNDFFHLELPSGPKPAYACLADAASL